MDVQLLINYVDGLQGAMLLLDGYVGTISYAAQLAAATPNGSGSGGDNVVACEFFLSGGPISASDPFGGGAEPCSGSCWTGYAHGS